MFSDVKECTTEELFVIWSYMGSLKDGTYLIIDENDIVESYIVTDGGHSVNNYFFDDVYLELINRGERVDI